MPEPESNASVEAPPVTPESDPPITEAPSAPDPIFTDDKGRTLVRVELEGVPEKFVSDGALNVSGLVSAYTTLEANKGKPPPAPDSYSDPTVDNAALGLPDTFEFQFDDEPQLQLLRAVGKEVGLSQAQYEALVSGWAQMHAQDFLELGKQAHEVLGENIHERIERVQGTLKGMLNDEEYAGLEAIADNPYAIQALEKILMNQSPTPPGGDSGYGATDLMSEKEIEEAMSHPEYRMPTAVGRELQEKVRRHFAAQHAGVTEIPRN